MKIPREGSQQESNSKELCGYNSSNYSSVPALTWMVLWLKLLGKILHITKKSATTNDRNES